MRYFFASLWNLIERASTLDTDSPEIRRRKVTLVVIALLSCAMGIIAGTNSYYATSKMERRLEEKEGFAEIREDAHFQNLFQILKNNINKITNI